MILDRIVYDIVHGMYGLGERNEVEERILDFAPA